jgi:DNA-binding NarL/FixJ family response regulator
MTGALEQARLPFTVAKSATALGESGYPVGNDTMTVVVLIDPTAESWSVPYSLDAPTIVVYSSQPSAPTVSDAVTRGARSVLLCDDAAAQIRPLLSLVVRGYLVLSLAYADTMLDNRTAGSAGSATTPELTTREREILTSIASGHTVRQSAHAMGIAVKTVENTQARLFRKLGTRNRSETLLRAYELGLIDQSSLSRA